MRHIFLIFKVHILFLLVYIYFLTFIINICFDFPSPRYLRTPAYQLSGKFPAYPITLLPYYRITLLPETMRKLCLSTKFPPEEIR